MLQEQTKKLLGTDIEITILSDRDESAVFSQCFAIFQGVQDEFSRFDPNSSLSRLNRDRSGHISPRFQDLGKKSQEMFHMTQGYFNPLCDISSLGYSQSFEKKSLFSLATKKQTKKSVQNLDIMSIDFSQEFLILKEGQQLDFGGIAKGYSVDLVRDFLLSAGHDNFCIDAGGDMFLQGNNELGKPWCIGVQHPFDEEAIIGTLELQNIAVATSGSYKRNWDIAGKNYHHIINPLSGKNATHLVSVTLLGEENYRVDSLATAIFCMPFSQALIFLETYKIAAILVDGSGKVYSNSPAKELYHFTLS